MRSLGLIVASMALVVAIACYGAAQEPERERESTIPVVEAVPARFGALPLEERLNGVVKAENQVSIHAEISAPIAEVFVRSGAQVERGQPLVRLREDVLRDQLRRAEASLRLARAEAAEAHARVTELEAQVRRSRALAAEQLISELDLETQEAQLAATRAGAEQAEARVEEARATLQERQTSLDKTLVRAPVSGRVGRRNAEVGMLVDSGTVLFVIGKLDELIVEVPLTESMLSYIEEGHPVRLTAPSLGEESLRATLSRISPFLSAGSFSTVAEIDVSNRGGLLRPGMFLTVDVLYGESDRATLVPASALWEDPRTGVEGVFVVEGLPAEPVTAGTQASLFDARVEFLPVQIVAEGRAAFGIRGLEEGAWVVTVGQHLLRSEETMPARVRPTSWDRLLELQALQREDLLRSFLDKQQRLAETLGVEPPTRDEVLESLMQPEGALPAAPR